MPASVSPFPSALRSLCREFFSRLEMERLKALAAIAWGVWVIVFDSFDSNPTFTYLIRTAAPLTGDGHAEYLWGGLMVVAGSLQLWGLWGARNGPRMVGALIGGTTWLIVGLCFMAYNPRSTTLIVYGQMSLANFALYYQVGTGRRPAPRAASSLPA